ncbi:hypothetical protein AB1E18_014350 [Capra hircus]
MEEAELPGVALSRSPFREAEPLRQQEELRWQLMSKYTVRVATSSLLGSGTWDRVSVSLVGTPGESSRLRLDGFGKEFRQDAMNTFPNGFNLVLIRYCRHLSKNFPVTDAMVAPMMGPRTSLQAELEKGSLYLVDHAILKGVRSSVINGQPQFLAAP